MKRRRLALMTGMVAFFLGACFWISRAPNGVGRSLQITPVTADTNQFSGEVTFLLTNRGSRYVMPEMIIVEVKTPTGWSAFGESRPTDATAVGLLHLNPRSPEHATFMRQMDCGRDSCAANSNQRLCVALITVERTSCLRSDIHPERCVLIVEPRLSVPPDGWKERTEIVSILQLDGRDFEATAQISLSHLNIQVKHRDRSLDSGGE